MDWDDYSEMATQGQYARPDPGTWSGAIKRQLRLASPRLSRARVPGSGARATSEASGHLTC